LLSLLSSKLKKAWSTWIGRVAKMKKLRGVVSRLMSKCKTMIMRRSLRGWLKATQKMSRRGREFELGSKALTKMFASAREKSLRLAMRILERRTLKYKQSRINVRSSLLCMKDFFARKLVEGNIQDVDDTVFVDSISESDNNVFASLAHDDMSRSIHNTRFFLTTSSRESSLSLFKILILHVQSRLLKKVWTRFVCRIEMLKKLRSCMSRILSNFRSTRVRASIRRWQNVCQYATRRLREIDLGVKMFARNFSLFRLKTMR